jgi:hypothetical protein
MWAVNGQSFWPFFHFVTIDPILTAERADLRGSSHGALFRDRRQQFIELAQISRGRGERINNGKNERKGNVSWHRVLIRFVSWHASGAFPLVFLRWECSIALEIPGTTCRSREHML